MHPHAQHPPTSASTHGAALQSGKLIRLPSVENLTGLKRSAIYAAMRAGTFPGSVRLSVRAVAWREAEVLAWCADRTKTGGEHV